MKVGLHPSSGMELLCHLGTVGPACPASRADAPHGPLLEAPHLAQATQRRRRCWAGTRSKQPGPCQLRAHKSVDTCLLCRGLKSHCLRGTRAQRGKVTCPRSHSTVEAGPEPSSLVFQPRAFIRKSLYHLGPNHLPPETQTGQRRLGDWGAVLPGPSSRRGPGWPQGGAHQDKSIG